MHPKTLAGPHEGRTVLTDDEGQPILIKVNVRESTSTPAKLKVAFYAEPSVPEEAIRKLIDDAPIPEDVDRDVAEQMLREAARAVLPIPYVRAQVPSDSMGYAVEIPLGLN